jgi:hypothetical protein
MYGLGQLTRTPLIGQQMVTMHGVIDEPVWRPVVSIIAWTIPGVLSRSISSPMWISSAPILSAVLTTSTRQHCHDPHELRHGSDRRGIASESRAAS